MSFFNRKSKEEKEQESIEDIKSEYGLKDIDEIDMKRFKAIKESKRGTAAMSFGAKTDTNLIEGYLQTIEEQNWMIIRLLEEIKTNQEK